MRMASIQAFGRRDVGYHVTFAKPLIRLRCEKVVQRTGFQRLMETAHEQIKRPLGCKFTDKHIAHSR